MNNLKTVLFVIIALMISCACMASQPSLANKTIESNLKKDRVVKKLQREFRHMKSSPVTKTTTETIACSVIMKGDTLNVTTSKPGELSTLIKYKNEVKKLKIIGKIDKDDAKFIRDMAITGKLVVLDLYDAQSEGYGSQEWDVWVADTTPTSDGYWVSLLDLSLTNLKSVTLPYSMTHIPERMFSGCIDLTKVIIPSFVTHIGSEAFSGCCDLDSVYAENVGYIGKSAFYACTSLSRLYLGSGQRKIARGAFMGWLTTIGTREINIDESAFKNCRSLKSLYIEDMVDIGNNTFENCDSLSFVCLPSVKTIGKFAFAGCKHLEEVYLGRLLTKIGEGALKDCEKIQRIGMLCGAKPEFVYGYENLDNSFLNTPESKQIYVLKGRYHDWELNNYEGAIGIAEAKTYFVRAVKGMVVDGIYDVGFE